MSYKPDCTRCRFFHNSDCRRFPPQVYADKDGDPVWLFPQMSQGEWCAEFQPPTPMLDLDAINERQLAAVRPDFELPPSIVPTEKEKCVRELLEDDIAHMKATMTPTADLAALQRHIAQKGLEVIRPSGLWFAGVHHGRKNP